MVLSMDRWVDKVAIVTGASSGIGAAIAENLVESGVIVVGVARRNENVEKLAKSLAGKKGKLYPLKCDLSNENEILESFKWVEKNLGPVSILVNNAGLVQATNLSNGETEKWKKVFDVNVMGLCIATREAIKAMKAHKIDGHIIHINSILGHKVFGPALNVYPATKHAVTALTETLRQELNHEKSKIKITSVSPGAVKTEIVSNGNENSDILDIFEGVPFLESEDVADAVAYVLSTPPHVQVHEIIVKPVNELF